MMKRITLVLAFLLVVAVAAMVTGCGSDTKQAKQYMKKGDYQLQNFESKVPVWSAQINSISADPAQIAVEVQQVKAAGRRLLRLSQAAKTEFGKIMGLKGVADYRKYVDLRIAELDILNKIIRKMHAFLTRRVVVVKSGDLSAYPFWQQRVQNEIDPLSEKGQKLEQEAEKLKSDKKL